MTQTKITDYLNSTFEGHVQNSKFDKRSGQEMIWVKQEFLQEVVKVVRNELGFDMLLDAFGTDWSKWPQKSPVRFEMSYLFYNSKEKTRLHIRSMISDDNNPKIDSLVEFYPSANWAEREAFDMFGIQFNGHPNLKRLLMWTEFEGHPLRKDYPIQKRQPIPVLDKLL